MPRASRSRKTVHDDDDEDEQEVEGEQEQEEQDDEEEIMQANDEEEEEDEDEELQDNNEEEEEEEERPRRGSRKAASKKKSSRRSKKVVEDNENDDDAEEEEEQENRGSNRQAKKQQQKKKNSKKPRTSVTAGLTQNDSSDDEEDNDNSNGNNGMQFLSQMPDASQDLPTAKASDRTNLLKLGQDARQKAISDLVRTILFKAMAGEPIHRQAIVKEAAIGGGGNTSGRIASAAFEEANIVLQNTFDFKLVRVPAWMERTKDLPAKCKERYYLVNGLDDPNGQICKIVHGVHKVDAMEKGLLMVILAFIFCKGEPRSDGSRWLLDKELYRLLHLSDENIHAEPPAASAAASNTRRSRGGGGNSAATTGTPDVDAVLEKCVHMDYLIKVKASSGEHFLAMSQEVEESSHFYAMGPRAALEIGRSQIVHFCASILDQEPDPHMLAEIEQAEQEEEQE